MIVDPVAVRLGHGEVDPHRSVRALHVGERLQEMFFESGANLPAIPMERDQSLGKIGIAESLFGEERALIEATLAAYGVPHDAALVRELGLVRNVAVIAWLAVFAERQPELLPRMRARLDRLPA